MIFLLLRSQSTLDRLLLSLSFNRLARKDGAIQIGTKKIKSVWHVPKILPPVLQDWAARRGAAWPASEPRAPGRAS